MNQKEADKIIESLEEVRRECNIETRFMVKERWQAYFNSLVVEDEQYPEGTKCVEIVLTPDSVLTAEEMLDGLFAVIANQKWEEYLVWLKEWSTTYPNTTFPDWLGRQETIK